MAARAAPTEQPTNRPTARPAGRRGKQRACALRSRPLKAGGTTGAGLAFFCPRPCPTTIGCNARRRLVHWRAATSVRPARAPPPPPWFASRTGEAGGAAAWPAPVPVPLTPRCPAGTCCARWFRRTRGAGSASRTAPWASPSGTPSGGCTGTTAWPAAPSPSQVPRALGEGMRGALLREGPGRGSHRCVCARPSVPTLPRSEVPERLHRDRAPAVPQGLLQTALLRAPLREAAGEPEPAVPLLPQHPARRRSVAARAAPVLGAESLVPGSEGGRQQSLIVPGRPAKMEEAPLAASGCERHVLRVANLAAPSRSKQETGTSGSLLKPSLILLESSLHLTQKQSSEYYVTLFSFRKYILKYSIVHVLKINHLGQIMGTTC